MSHSVGTILLNSLRQNDLCLILMNVRYKYILFLYYHKIISCKNNSDKYECVLNPYVFF